MGCAEKDLVASHVAESQQQQCGQGFGFRMQKPDVRDWRVDLAHSVLSSFVGDNYPNNIDNPCIHSDYRIPTFYESRYLGPFG